MSSLTDEDREAIMLMSMTGTPESTYLAGMRAGAERMRELAAKACSSYASHRWVQYKCGAGPERQGNSNGAHDCSELIRALPLTEDK